MVGVWKIKVKTLPELQKILAGQKSKAKSIPISWKNSDSSRMKSQITPLLSRRFSRMQHKETWQPSKNGRS